MGSTVCGHLAEWLKGLETEGSLAAPPPAEGDPVGEGWGALIASTTREVWEVPLPLVLDTEHDIHHWFMNVRCAEHPGPFVLVHLCNGPGGCAHEPKPLIPTWLRSLWHRSGDSTR